MSWHRWIESGWIEAGWIYEFFFTGHPGGRIRTVPFEERSRPVPREQRSAVVGTEGRDHNIQGE